MFRAALIIAGLAVLLHFGVLMVSLERVQAPIPLALASSLPTVDRAEAVDLINSYGCDSCHKISGIASAKGEVGPNLSDFEHQSYIAGHLPNTQENLVRWLMNPQTIEPGTAMPNLNLASAEAAKIAAYLYGQGH